MKCMKGTENFDHPSFGSCTFYKEMIKMRFQRPKIPNAWTILRSSIEISCQSLVAI